MWKSSTRSTSKCSWITTPLLLGRACIECNELQRTGEMAKGLQHFAGQAVRFEQLPSTPVMAAAGIPVYCARAVSIPPMCSAIVQVTSD